MNRIQSFVTKLFLPTSILATFTAFLFTLHLGGDIELTLLLSSIVVLGFAIFLERIFPYENSWNVSKGDTWTDLISIGVLLGVLEPLLKGLVPIIVIWLYSLVEIPYNFVWFPTEIPFLFQVLVATLVIELGSYWSHRWHHSNSQLWWLHALHHSSERLYTINNFRFHPLNHILNYFIGLFPLFLIGTPQEVLYAYIALSQPVLILQHSNIPLKNGLLNYIFNTNEIHRWHHSTTTVEANNNYGRALIVWDIVFGTFLYPKEKDGPDTVGLFASERYPARATYLTQVCSMFSRDCCKA